MFKTLRISFSLKNTYRVNGILYALKQIPLIKKILPDSLYRIQGFKIFANILSVLWEFVSAFLWKFLYFLFMISMVAPMYEKVPQDTMFIHLLFWLTLIGSFVNTIMFDPTKDKYYAIVLLNMNAREYTLINYFYAMLKIAVAFGLFGLLFGSQAGLPIWQCLLIPFFVVGIKIMIATYALWRYERTGKPTNENLLNKYQWIGILLLLLIAYAVPFSGIATPKIFVLPVMAFIAVAGFLCMFKLVSFPYYREVYKELLSETMAMQVSAKNMNREMSHKSISADTQIQSRKKGFEYLNELFIRRHQKILWKSVKKISLVCIGLIAALLVLFAVYPQAKQPVNDALMTSLPISLFVMYIINRGTSFTRALFINCDHSLLTYSFYKQPKFILQLFQIRLREIIKINLLPATIIGFGLALLLFASGGTDAPLDYVVLIVSIICLSIFFSVHYLTIYYLLQPYNAETDIKSGMYQLIMSATYMVCYIFIQIELPTLYFGAATIIFCILYCIVASILVYKLASKTFKIRT